MTALVRVAGDPGYDVFVGRDLLAGVAAAVPGAQRIAVIHPGVLHDQAAALQSDLTGSEVLLIEVPDAESQKTAEVADLCWSILGEVGFTRSDAVVGLGGGATTDLAGFVGATWLRGIRVVQIPTTLLGMVDAAIGGKTGINTAAGKNLVGAFHPPAAVLCDLDILTGLPAGELVPGMAEVVKVGFTHDPRILEIIESDAAESMDPRGSLLPELIERAARVKAGVVGADLRETVAGGREVLNYGHTLGHAIEKLELFEWRHGAAVSVGLVFAAELGRIAVGLPDDVVDRHRSILASLGLPVSYDGSRWPDLLSAMSVDKKKRGNSLRFIVLADLARPTGLDAPDPAVLAAAFQEVAE